MLLWMWLVWGCGGQPNPGEAEAPLEPGLVAHPMDKGADQEVVGHRPIPANNPVWDALDGSFHRAPEFYGERSWDDVIMRVMGHYEHAARDLASNRASQGDLAGAAQDYRRLAQWLEGIVHELIQLVTEDDKCPSVIKELIDWETLKFKDRDELEDVFSSWLQVHQYDIEKLRD